MPELLITLKGIYEKEHRINKFMAALQGVDIDEGSKKETETAATTIEDVYARVAKRLGANENESEAIKQGFTPEMGLSYEIIRDNG